MPHSWSSRASRQVRLPGRVLLPAGFAALVGASIYLVGDGRGYERGVGEAVVVREATPVVVSEPAADGAAGAISTGALAKADRLDIPVLIRAIEPGAVYSPPQTGAGASKTVQTSAALALPAGVERFDQCGDACETRDPMIVRASYAVVAPAVSAPVSEARETGPFGLPALPGAGEVVDRTVKGTTAAYDALKEGTVATYDAVKGALGKAIGLTY